MKEPAKEPLKEPVKEPTLVPSQPVPKAQLLYIYVDIVKDGTYEGTSEGTNFGSNRTCSQSAALIYMYRYSQAPCLKPDLELKFLSMMVISMS